MKSAVIMGVLAVAVFTGSFCGGAESENPFGFETHTHPLTYGYCRRDPDDLDPHRYVCNSAPRPHPDFYLYHLRFAEDDGLCAIASLTHADSSAADLGNVIEKIKEQIAKKYGSGRPGKHPVVYMWDKKAGFHGLGDVEQIRMFTWRVYYSSSDSSSGLVIHERSGVFVNFLLEKVALCQRQLYDKGSQAF